MKIEKFVLGSMGTNCYIAVNEENGGCFLVDPAAWPPELSSHIRAGGKKPLAVLLTHGHFDHIMGLDGLLREYDIPVYAFESEKEVLNSARLNLSAMMAGAYTFSDARYVKDGQILDIGGVQIRVIHTPGHTAGGCCYHIPEENVLFSGDTLFRASVGRTDLPTGSMGELVRSVREKLMVLPEETKVYPGHMEETTIGYEKRYNPFL